jgi:2-phosphosulfolactate phosphatase
MLMQEKPMKSLEICFSPALFGTFDPAGKIVVLVDILRATSTICAALNFGVKEIIPVSTVEEALTYKEKGYMVAGERDGKVLDFADFGNSPFNFMNDAVVGKSIVYTTTNGTKAIATATGCNELLIGAYLNLSVLAEYLRNTKNDVIIFCSGWKNKFNLEDTLFAGALAERLMKDKNFSTVCDSTLAATDLWSIAKNDLMAYIQKAAHRERLRKLGLDDVLEYCHTPDLAPVIPVYHAPAIVKK